MRLAVLGFLVSQLAQPAPSSPSGVVVDARTRSPIAGAEVTIVDVHASARTDREGRFRLITTVPSTPVTVVVILPGGRVARPIRVDEWPKRGDVVLAIEPALRETITVTGIAPGIDTGLGASSTFVSRADLEMRHPATLAQSLENVPGVSPISDGGQGAVPAIRGLARERSLILVDGSRVSTERRAGPNASFLDPADVDSVEVARGPASVAYGSDAFGGVIAVQTRRSPYGAPFQVRLSGTAGAGIPERRGEIEVAGGSGSNAVIASARARSFGDYRAPAGRVPNSGWRDGGITGRWDHAGRDQTWSVGWLSGLGREIGRPRSDASSMVATTPYEDSHRLSIAFDRRTAAGDVRVNGFVGIARERTQQDRLATARQPRNVTQADTSYRDTQLRATIHRMVGAVSLAAGTDVQGVYGLMSDDRTIAYDGKGAIATVTTNPSIESARRTGVGLFTQATAMVAPRVRLSGGARADTVRNANDAGYFGDRRINNSALAGVAGATVSLSRRATVSAQIARGFRDPTLTDRFYRGPNGRGFIEGNPDLRPETSRQVDVTGGWGTSRIQFSGAFYDYRIANLVERYVVGGANFFVRNRGAARLRGVEVEARGRLAAGLMLGVTAQTSRGRDAVTDAPIDDVAPRSFTFSLTHAAGARVSSFVRAAAIARHAAAGPSEVPTPGYVDVDGGAVWRLTPRIDVRAVARNLLNAQWYSNAGPRWVYAPGRNGSISVTVSLGRNRSIMPHR